MINETLKKIHRMKILWSEIKGKEQEYSRLCKQIEDLEQTKKDVSFDIQKRVHQCQQITDKLIQNEFKTPSDEDIIDAATKWVFDENGGKWSNNDDTAGDNFNSFITGTKWALNKL